jgi:O-acetyl-ADP-ribose deacetylase (regulator of RNase III)/ADP-ribose pyrophosphatase YjhB (NUDIX family)
MKLKDTEIKVMMGDITELEVDAVVNAANNELLMGGGVAAAIKKKGGRIIEEEAVKLGPIEIGQAVSTIAGNLNAKYVIHAVTMGMDFKTDETKIRSSCAASLKEAEKLKVSTVAFPALGCGVGGFPLLASAKIMAQEVFKHLREGKSVLKEIIFCLFNKQADEVFNKTIFSYLDYITTKLGKGPFVTVDAIIEIPASVPGDFESIVIIQRSNPPFGWALPGGFLDYGETLEEAVTREAKEETGLDLHNLKQFHTYSDPNRDPRFHTIGTVFIATGKGKPMAGDDARDLRVVKLSEIKNLCFAFDHGKIIQDYLSYRKINK